MESTIKLYSLSLKEVKTYLFTTLFVVGNIVLPQLCHLIPQGGLMFLPIYFFTLIGAYKYGLKVGLLTAVFSPIINSVLFGMPAMAVLPIILVKSILLAVCASTVAASFKQISLLLMVVVVLGYQIVGTLVEWVMVGDFFTALQDLRIGLPGIVIQIFGGYLFIKYLIRK